MNSFLERALFHLTGNDNINLVSEEELEKLTADYPYFSVGQMLLAKKYKEQHVEKFLPQVQKTALYFSNPYWLHYQLLNEVPSATVIHDNEIAYQENEPTEAALEDKVLQPLVLDTDEHKFPPETPKFSKKDIDASSTLAKVVLTDGDDNISAEELVHGNSTLPEPVNEESNYALEETLFKEHEDEPLVAENNIEARNQEGPEDASIIEEQITETPTNGLKEENQLPSQNDTEIDEGRNENGLARDEQADVEDVPITTEFSLEEIEASDKLAHETLADVETVESGEQKFILPYEVQPEDVPITTEFSLEEIEASDKLAKETLADVDTIETGEQKFVLPHEPEPQDVPITTEFSLEEIEASEKLAKETLANVDANETGEQKFVLPQETLTEDLSVANETSLEEPGVSEKSAGETFTAVDSEDVRDDHKFELPEEAGIHADDKALTPEEDSIDKETGLENIAASEELTNEPLPVVDNKQQTEPQFSMSGISSAENVDENVSLIEDAPVQAETLPEGSPDTTTRQIETVGESQAGIVKDEAREELEERDPRLIDEYEENLPHASPEQFSNEEMLKNIKSILDAPQPQEKPAENEPLIPIDPYHTVDYFASQGIKLVLEKDPKDKLGRQLKSFTQWLRHMKKLGPEDAIEAGNKEAAEATIPKIADSSNTQQEVVTEAMAEVLEKQGKTDKAVEVYAKLSFMYPDKSVYFAHKIKNIKGI